MGELFKDGRDQLRENGETAIGDRRFRLLLLGNNPRATVDVNTDTTLDAVLDNHRENARVGDVALRLQVIGDPTKPFGIRDRLYQFFVEEGSRTTVRENLGSGVIYEASQEGEKPIAFVNRDEVGMMISGEGYTITVPYQPGEPAAPVPVATEKAQELSIQSDADANAVADETEYVEGDPDKGVRADAGLERVGVIGLEEKAKPGTTAEEGRARMETEPQGGSPSDTTSAERSETPRTAASAEEPADRPERTSAPREEPDPAEESQEISSITRPTQLSEQFSKKELKEYADENEIEVTRQDGEGGAPLAADYARAIANFNRRQRRTQG